MIRANNAERRLANAQNQLAAAEEKMAAMNQKTTAADTKWEARVKEYEARLRTAEEKVKRERQGYKERVVELETQIKCVCPARCCERCLIRFSWLKDPYRDNGSSRRSGTSSWSISRPRYHTRWHRQHDSLSMLLFHACFLHPPSNAALFLTLTTTSRIFM